MSRLVPAIAVTVAAGLGTAALGRIYSGTELYVWVAIAVAGALLVAVGVNLLRLRVLLSALASLVGFFVLTVVVVFVVPSMDTGSLVALYLGAVRNTGAQVLTATIPVQVSPATLVLPMAIGWLAAATGAEIVLRVGRALLGLLPAVLALTAALVLIGPNAPGSVWAMLGFIFVAAVALVASRPSGGVRRAVTHRMRAGVSAAIAVVIFVGAVVVMGPAIAGLRRGDPVDPRRYVTPPQQRLDQVNPLGEISGWAQRPNEVLLRVDSATPQRIRLVVLEDYDGLAWTPASAYRSAGSVLPTVAGGDGPGQSVRQRLTVVGLTGLWLPAVDAPRQLAGVQASVDDTGCLVRPQGLQPGLAYSVTSNVREVPASRLVTADTPTSGDVATDLAVPAGTPPTLTALAQAITKQGNTPYQRALLLERYLRSTYSFDPNAASGHGFATLNFFLTQKNGKRGTSEQFAASFALLARIIGLPTRVVVGFHAGNKVGGNSWVVRSGDAFAWPEVYFNGAGWVAFDPTPAATSAKPPQEALTPQAKKDQQVKQQQLSDLGAAPGKQGPGQDPDKASPPAPLLLRLWPLWTVLVVFLVFVGIGAGLSYARRRRSRARLTAREPAARIVGSWAEVLDTLRLDGRRPPPHLSATEIATWAVRTADPAGVSDDPDDVFGGLPPLQPLADLVNGVSFSAGPAAAADAARAVAFAQGYESALLRHRGRLRRLWWRINPRPLTWKTSRATRGAPVPADR